MELYMNTKWTKCHGENYYIAEAIMWSENGNHASIYSTGSTAEEADAKLMGALSELKLIPETSTKDVQ
jgi:predicted heme/steroid binding protein